MTGAPGTSLYLENLLSLPFVRNASLRAEPAPTRRRGEAILELTTPAGHRKLRVEEKRSHLSHALVGDLIARTPAHTTTPLIVFAPYVSSEMGVVLAARGINFVDRAGNCRLDLGGRYVAHVEGRRLRPSSDAPKGMRAAGFRLVFALLVEPDLLNASVRALAGASSVSLGTTANVLRRLEQDRIVVRTKSKRHIVRRDDLIERWIAGYAETLRPQLIVGRFQTPDRDPLALEDHAAAVLGPAGTWAWGGGAAAFRLTRHYRGPDTVLHVESSSADLPGRLNAVPHRAGPLMLLGVPGPLAFRGPVPRVVHPILVYTELVLTGSDRAGEAASEIRERFLRE
jgi:hypothetical protein